MNTPVTLFLTLLQFCALGQPDRWDKESIKRNRVKEVSIYVAVPKTNPEHPKMLWRQASFDSEGRLAASNCKGCHVETHRPGGWSADVIEMFNYETDKLVRIDIMDFEISTVHYYYNKEGNKRLKITTNKNGERTGTALEHLDKVGREILVFNIEFEGAYTFDDSVSQVFITKSAARYEKQSTVTDYYTSDELVNMGSTISESIFKVLKSSIDFNEVETVLTKVDLNFLTLWRQETTKISRDKIQTKNTKTGDIRVEFFLDANGLITKERREMGQGVWEFEYQYKYSN